MADDKRRVPACEDTPTIAARLIELRDYRDRKCWRALGRALEGCWCYRAGPLGASLPCPPSEPQPPAATAS